MPTKKRSHRNNLARLTAKERATAVVRAYFKSASFASPLEKWIERALQAHAREAVARYKRRHAVAWDRMLKGAGK